VESPVVAPPVASDHRSSASSYTTTSQHEFSAQRPRCQLLA